MQADATQADIDSLQSPSVFRGLHSQALLLPSQADTFGGSQTDDEGGGSVPFFKGRPPPTLTNSTGGSSTRPPNPRINTLWTDGHSAGLSTSSGTPSALPSQTPSVSTPRPPTSANSTLWSTSYTRADVSNPKAPPSNFNFVGDSSRTPNSASTTISWSRNTPHARSKEGLQTQQTNPLPPLHKHLPSRAPTFVPPSQYSANQSSASQNVFSEPTPLNIPPSDSPSPMPYPTEPKLFIMRKELELLMADVLKQLKVAHDFLAQSREHLQSNVEHEISSKNNEYEGVKELFDQMDRSVLKSHRNLLEQDIRKLVESEGDSTRADVKAVQQSISNFGKDLAGFTSAVQGIESRQESTQGLVTNIQEQLRRNDQFLRTTISTMGSTINQLVSQIEMSKVDSERNERTHFQLLKEIQRLEERQEMRASIVERHLKSLQSFLHASKREGWKNTTMTTMNIEGLSDEAIATTKTQDQSTDASKHGTTTKEQVEAHISLDQGEAERSDTFQVPDVNAELEDDDDLMIIEDGLAKSVKTAVQPMTRASAIEKPAPPDLNAAKHQMIPETPAKRKLGRLEFAAPSISNITVNDARIPEIRYPLELDLECWEDLTAQAADLTTPAAEERPITVEKVVTFQFTEPEDKASRTSAPNIVRAPMIDLSNVPESNVPETERGKKSKSSHRKSRSEPSREWVEVKKENRFQSPRMTRAQKRKLQELLMDDTDNVYEL